MGLQLPPRLRKAALWTVVSVGMLSVGACSAEDQAQIKRFALPEPATDRAEYTFDLWHGAWIAALIIGVLVWGLILYAVFAFRRRHDDEVPVQTRYNLPIEILYTVAPIIIVLVLFYFTVTVQNQVLAPAASKDGDDVPGDHQIQVVGYQWSWSFNYIGDDALDGQTDVYEGGTTGDRPKLVLPVDESIDVTLTSPDVIHSFWVPAFLFKMDVVPGRNNSFSFTPTEEGTFKGRCAELCGTYHSRMLFDVEVVSPERYADYLRTLQERGQVGRAVGGEGVDAKVGLEEEVQDDDLTSEDAQ